MNPIYLYNDKQEGNIGINSKDLKKDILRICNEHRKNNRARIFAFVLTDFHTTEANHFVLNSEFWNTLHTLSGHFLTIFHLDFKSEEVNKLFRTGQTEFVKEQYDNFFKSLNNIFDTDEFDKIKCPAILFFQTEQAEILDFFCQELDSNNLQNNMYDLKDYIKSAVESVSKLPEENLNNSSEIYQLLKLSVESKKTKKVWTSRIMKAVRFYDLLKSLL